MFRALFYFLALCIICVYTKQEDTSYTWSRKTENVHEDDWRLSETCLLYIYIRHINLTYTNFINFNIYIFLLWNMFGTLCCIFVFILPASDVVTVFTLIYFGIQDYGIWTVETRNTQEAGREHCIPRAGILKRTLCSKHVPKEKNTNLEVSQILIIQNIKKRNCKHKHARAHTYNGIIPSFLKLFFTFKL